MNTYTIRANRKQHERQLLTYIGEANTVQIDFAPWESDNGSVTSVDWATKSGQAGITNESLSSSIASALITTSQEGRSLIKVTATAGNNIFVLWLDVKSKDLQSYQPSDY